MDLFKKALGAFVDFDEKKEVSKELETQEIKKVPSHGVPSQSFNFDSSKVPEGLVNQQISASQGAFNQDFYNHLQEEIAKNNQDGADYYEFRKTFEALKKSMPDMAALSATYNALKATSPELSVTRLLETADIYLSVLEQEDVDFTNQFDNQYNTEVIGRENQISVEMQLQADLEFQLEASKETVKTLQIEKLAEDTKLTGVKANWDVTLKLVKANIETDKTNISAYLETNPV
jgi:hypothetical protein